MGRSLGGGGTPYCTAFLSSLPHSYNTNSSLHARRTPSSLCPVAAKHGCCLNTVESIWVEVEKAWNKTSLGCPLETHHHSCQTLTTSLQQHHVACIKVSICISSAAESFTDSISVSVFCVDVFRPDSFPPKDGDVRCCRCRC